MAKKAKKRVTKKTSAAKKKKASLKRRQARATKRKFKEVVRNIMIYGILFILSFLLSSVSGSELADQILGFFMFIFGFITLAFIIVLIALLFLRLAQK